MALDKQGERLKDIRDHLLRTRNFDAAKFAAESFSQAVQKRLSANKLSDPKEYVDLLEARPAEYQALFDEFFAHAHQFEGGQRWSDLKERLWPELLSGEEAVRIWNVGCRTGIDTYRLAISLCETLGVKAVQQRVKIFATETSEELL